MNFQGDKVLLAAQMQFDNLLNLIQHRILDREQQVADVQLKK